MGSGVVRLRVYQIFEDLTKKKKRNSVSIINAKMFVILKSICVTQCLQTSGKFYYNLFHYYFLEKIILLFCIVGCNYGYLSN